MQHIHRFLTCGQIDYAVGSGCVPYANLFYPRTYSFHRLPILRFEASLHEVQIEASIPPCLIGEGLQIIVASTHKLKRFTCNFHIEYYTGTCIFIQVPV